MRKVFDASFRLAACSCAAIACGLLLLMIASMAVRGLPALSWNFLVRDIEEAGAGGGIRHNILGTLILIGTGVCIGAPIALGAALTHEVYLRASRHRRKLTILLHLLNGVPSIVLGIAGMIVFAGWLRLGKSWLTGGVLLGLIMVPTVAVAVIDRIAAMPAKYVEAAAGLGLSHAQIVRAVVLPQSVGALATGCMLGLARVAGETAPIMFTATVFAGAGVPRGIREEPVLSLPYHIFVLAQDSFDVETAPRLWGAALTLLGIVMCLSLMALPFRLRAHEEARHG